MKPLFLMHSLCLRHHQSSRRLRPRRPDRFPAPTFNKSISVCCRKSKRSLLLIIMPTPDSPMIPTLTPWPRLPTASEALRTRDDNPELIAAAKALFGYPYSDLSPEHSKWLVEKKAELKKQYPGTAYFNMILDKINTESSVANRAMMPDYLDPNRFPWVFFADSFMWPFNNERETARNPDEGVYIPLQEKMLHRWMQQENVS